MTNPERDFAGSAPDLYESALVPVLFAPYAAELARRLAAESPARVLELAAGTGALTRALVAELPHAQIVATDLNQSMLDRAASSAELTEVAWRQCDAQVLPFADASFEAAVCQFGIMFVPDKVRAYREARRVLAPGGQLVLATWDRLGTNDFAAVLADALARSFPDDPPRFIDQVPHGYYDPALIERELTAGGFERIECELVARTSHASSARDLAAGFLLGTPVGAVVRERAPDRLEEIIVSLETALRDHFGSGEISGVMTALVVTASPSVMPATSAVDVPQQ